MTHALVIDGGAWTSRAVAAGLCALTLGGCISQTSASRVCPNSELEFGKEFRGSAYLVHDYHGSVAVLEACPDIMLVAEAAMETSEERHQFWSDVRRISIPAYPTPVLKGTVAATVDPPASGTEAPILRLSRVESLERSHPPQEIQRTLGLGGQE